MAATAGSVAVGSTIGHGISNMLFGSSHSATAAPETQAPPVQQQHNQSRISCETQAKGESRRVNSGVALKQTLGALDKMESEGGTLPADTKVVVTIRDFCNALDKVGPSVSVAQRKRYEALRNKFAGLPVRGKQVQVEEELKP